MMGKLKSINVKGFAVNHGEKVVFGLVAVFALYLLAGTNWLPFAHFPREITNKVKEAEETLANKSWPAEEQTEFFVPPDEAVSELVSVIRTHVDPSPYELVQNFEFDLYGTKSPITEPEFLPVRALLADADRLVMYVNPEEDETEFLDDETDEPDDENQPSDEEDDVPEAFRSHRSGGNTSGRRTSPGPTGGQKLSFSFNSDDNDDSSGGSRSQPGGGHSQSTEEGRGQRYVAVRGVVPLRDQITKIKKASVVNRSTAELLYVIKEFELERKKKRNDAEDAWGGEWEPVDIEVSIEVLRDAPAFEPEVVQGTITDSVITMPLPQLVMGVWGKNATHPDLANFTLSDDEIKLEMEIFERLLKRHQEEQEELPEAPVTRGGFADLVHDSRSLSRTVQRGGASGGGNDEGGGLNFGLNFSKNSTVSVAGGPSFSEEEFLEEFEDIPDEQLRTKLREYVQEQITPSGELLLFRYLDFDVEPGATYKYRVRLEVMNPNYGRKSSAAAGLAHVVEGQTRKTDWSNETPPTSVLQDVDYFVNHIDDSTGRSLMKADMTLYQWDPDYGTTVADKTLLVELGAEVGGRAMPYVLNPAQERFELEDYTFQTGDLLIDALHEDRIRPDHHPDLKLSGGRHLELSDQVLVLRGTGELFVVDELSRKQDLKDRERLLGFERREFEDLKSAEVKPSRSNSAYGGGGLFGNDQAKPKTGRRSSRKNSGRGNTLRKLDFSF